MQSQRCWVSSSLSSFPASHPPHPHTRHSTHTHCRGSWQSARNIPNPSRTSSRQTRRYDNSWRMQSGRGRGDLEGGRIRGIAGGQGGPLKFKPPQSNSKRILAISSEFFSIVCYCYSCVLLFMCYFQSFRETLFVEYYTYQWRLKFVPFLSLSVSSLSIGL